MPMVFLIDNKPAGAGMTLMTTLILKVGQCGMGDDAVSFCNEPGRVLILPTVVKHQRLLRNNVLPVIIAIRKPGVNGRAIRSDLPILSLSHLPELSPGQVAFA